MRLFVRLGGGRSSDLVSLDVSQDSTVAQIKALLYESARAPSPSHQMLVHRARVLPDSESIQSAGIRERSYVHAYVMCDEHETSELARAEAAASSESDSKEDDWPSVRRRLAELITPEVLAPLLEMGFSHDAAIKALLLNGLNQQLALEWLFAHGDDPRVHAPMSDQELLHVAQLMGLGVARPVAKEIRACLERKQCTYSHTGSRFTAQEYVTCLTCNLTTGRGCCLSCAEVCHAGHDISDPIRSESFYCDCGSGDGPIECKALKLRRATAALVERGGGEEEKEEKRSEDAAEEKAFRERMCITDSHMDREVLERYVTRVMAHDLLQQRDERVLRNVIDHLCSEQFSGGDGPREHFPNMSAMVGLLPTLLNIELMSMPDGLVTLLTGLLLYNRVQRSFADMYRSKSFKLINTVVKKRPFDNDPSPVLLAFFLNATAAKELQEWTRREFHCILNSECFQSAFGSAECETRLICVSILSNLALITKETDRDLQFSLLTSLLTSLRSEKNVLLVREALCALGALVVRCVNCRRLAISMGAKPILTSLATSSRHYDEHRINGRAQAILNLLL